jgi:hypothetical protein
MENIQKENERQKQNMIIEQTNILQKLYKKLNEANKFLEIVYKNSTHSPLERETYKINGYELSTLPYHELTNSFGELLRKEITTLELLIEKRKKALSILLICKDAIFKSNRIADNFDVIFSQYPEVKNYTVERN